MRFSGKHDQWEGVAMRSRTLMVVAGQLYKVSVDQVLWGCVCSWQHCLQACFGKFFWLFGLFEKKQCGSGSKRTNWEGRRRNKCTAVDQPSTGAAKLNIIPQYEGEKAAKRGAATASPESTHGEPNAADTLLENMAEYCRQQLDTSWEECTDMGQEERGWKGCCTKAEVSKKKGNLQLSRSGQQ